MFGDFAGLGVAANELFILVVAFATTRVFFFATTGSCPSRAIAIGLYGVCYRRSDKQKCCEDGDDREWWFHHISPLRCYETFDMS